MNVFDVLREKLSKASKTMMPVIPTADAIEIVNQVEQEYNNGWIPCSERLPDEYDSIFAKFVGTDKWKDSMFKKTSDTVNVTVADDKGQSVTTYAHLVDGEWSCDLLRCNKEYRITAWQPLPEAYREEGIPKKQTNADRIRAMTDEELAEFLPIVSNLMCKVTDKCIEVIVNRGECTKTTECALNWLQKEA